MKNNLPKILMLGWEFPPIINGGLGVACHELSGAMSQISDITMVVPKSSPGFKVKNVNLVGINNINISQLEHDPLANKEIPFQLHSVPANLDPYYLDNVNFHGENKRKENFGIDNLSGGDVIKKVFQYSD